MFCVVIAMDVVGHGLNLHVHVLSFVSWRNMELDVVNYLIRDMVVEVVMAYGENLGRNSEGI